MTSRDVRPLTEITTNRVLIYDLDFTGGSVTQVLRRIRFSKQSPQTPVLPIYEQRLTNVSPGQLESVFDRDNLTMRSLNLCYDANNKETTRTVYIPYKPIDVNHKIMIDNYLALTSTIDNLLTMDYYGEDLNNFGRSLLT